MKELVLAFNMTTTVYYAFMLAHSLRRRFWIPALIFAFCETIGLVYCFLAWGGYFK